MEMTIDFMEFSYENDKKFILWNLVMEMTTNFMKFSYGNNKHFLFNLVMEMTIT